MKEFDIFFSWQSDLPGKEYKNYIWRELEKTCKELDTEEMKVTPTESTRGNAGAVEIKDTVLSKIANCQIFICDVSIIGKINDKGTSNPNVMFELGYAVSCLGWERIVLVFNEASGKINDLPFDIRNHRILSYNTNKQLSLKEPILSIVKQYDDLEGNFLKSPALKFDIQIFNKRCSVVSEDELIESIKHSINNAGYSKYYFNIWDKLWYTYENDERQKFRDNEIHNAYSSFVKHLQNYWFVLNSIIGNPEHRGEYYEDMSKEEKEEEDKRVWYKLKDYYALGYDDDKAEELHQKDWKKFMTASKDVLPQYDIFRTLIRKKLFL